MTDTILNPVIPYPADSVETTYQVKLVVTNITRNTSDSLTLPVIVPFSPEVQIVTNDTILCVGDSITLNATITHGDGYWLHGDTSLTTVVKATGTYFFDMQDKPQLAKNASFENSDFSDWTTTSGWTMKRDAGQSPIDSSYCVYGSTASYLTTGIYEFSQDVDVSFDSVKIDSGISKNSVTGYVRGHRFGPSDEGQMIVEYYDASNVLLAISSTGSEKRIESWDYLNHSRTTPKNTRKIKIRLQFNKLNESAYGAYIYFDKIQVKMRSSCEYKDSVYIQFNQNPEVELPNDTFFCKGDSFLITPEITYYDPYIVNDTLQSSSTGSLKNDAEFAVLKEGVVLTPNIGYKTGQIEWEDSTIDVLDTFSVSFDIWVDKTSYSHYYSFWFYIFSASTPTSQVAANEGYKIGIFGNSGSDYAYTYWSSSRLNYNYINQHMDGAGWKKVKIIYSNQTIKLYLDGILLSTYTDTSPRTRGGNKFGISSANYYANSGYYNETRIRNFIISKNNLENVVVPKTNNITDYTWNTGSVNSSYLTKNTGTYTLQVRDNMGCESNTDSTYIEAVQQYDSLLSEEEKLCDLLDSFQLQMPDTNGHYYDNLAVDSFGMVNISSATYGQNTIYFSVVDTFGCLLKDTGFFLLDSVPIIQIDSVRPVCKNDPPFTFTVNNNDGYFFGGAFIDSFGNFDPALTTSRFNKIYYNTFGDDCIGKDS
ncbi:MAG: hypothetical protein ACPGTP_08655, partial [Bacteroidia bacterium]